MATSFRPGAWQAQLAQLRQRFGNRMSQFKPMPRPNPTGANPPPTALKPMPGGDFTDTRAPGTNLTAQGVNAGSLPSGLGASPGFRMKKGGKVASASKRADGIAQRGKTRGKMR